MLSPGSGVGLSWFHSPAPSIHCSYQLLMPLPSPAIRCLLLSAAINCHTPFPCLPPLLPPAPPPSTLTLSSASLPRSPCPYPVDPWKWWGPMRLALKAACTRAKLRATRASIDPNSGCRSVAHCHTCAGGGGVGIVMGFGFLYRCVLRHQVTAAHML